MHVGAKIAGRYRLIAGPARGGTGEVWLAEDTRLDDRKVVLKGVPADRRGAAADALVREESHTQARFVHPHVVVLHDRLSRRGLLRTGHWLVMEYVPGGSLAKWTSTRPGQAARIGADIAAALEALHAEGIVHCDVKPGNIVVTADGTAKLADFGAAVRPAGPPAEPRGIMRTPGYAAPEVEAGRPEPASDVYSLGAALHRLITGLPPAHWPGEVPAPETGPLRGLLASMLQDDPAARPPAAEVRRLLDAAADPGRIEPRAFRDVTFGATGAAPGAPGDDDEFPDPAQPVSRRAGGSLVRAPLDLVSAHRTPVVVSGVVLAAAVALVITRPPWGHGGHHAASPSRDAPVSLIGDQRTLDPCALTDPAALRKFGDSRTDAHYGNFNRCDVLVTRGGPDDYIDVETQLLPAPAPGTAGPVKYVQGFGVVPAGEDAESCSRKVLLPAPDQATAIEVIAKSDGGKAPLCTIAGTAAASAAGVLHRGPVARRNPPLPAASIAQRDACQMLAPQALDDIPGVNATSPETGFGRWECGWNSTTQSLGATLRFDQGQPLDAHAGRPTRLAGRPAFVQADEGQGSDRTCTVQVVARTYRGPDGAISELLHLDVEGDWPVQRLCTLATTLAGAAAAALRT
ncbi:serine/threonine-protein kinase [Actinomadura verrucosospora]|uniref:non-specific serine/threonine protein kinase n=1 Tax=Actinomadura verrucosospora TaxID=46165 RepID=A0A7D3W2D9_ACTVE|nr:serine/threonine-protein kinase [Actinomadura verrucosospora]QKG24411.1 non-specific serine/threonine protein kinase [Actinomadura verrucosospora]